MNAFFTKLYRFSCKLIQACSLFLTGALFLSSFLFTCYADNMETQQVLFAVDNPLANLVGLLLFVGLVFLCCKLVCRDAARRKRLLLRLVLCWTVLLGGVLILFSKTVPAADAMSVYAAAESMAKGDTSVIHPTDSYLSYYTQQVGLMAFFEVLIRLWRLLPTGLPAYHFIKCVYVLLTCAIIYAQYASVHLLWNDDRADCVYLILAGTNLPLILYSSFVYGEIPSFAAMSAGLYFLLRLLQSKHSDAFEKHAGRAAAALSLICFTLSVMLRKNSLIFIIAVVLIVLMECCKTSWRSLLVYGVLCAALSLSILPLTQKAYELRAGNYLRSGVPAMSYFAMGMQESSRGNGWYNGFNFNTYRDTGMDTEATNEVSRQAIATRLSYFREHPGYAAGFYFNKYLTQWADGTYASRQATLATFGGRQAFFQSLYEGAYSSYYIRFCNLHQLVVYLGCFLFVLLLWLRKQTQPLYVCLGLTAVFGGFLFHMIWEANARYIFPYGLLLLPYAARGIAEISSTFSLEKFRRNRQGRTADATEKPTTAA